MTVSTVRLEEALCIADTGTWGDEPNQQEGVPILRSSNIQEGQLVLEDVAWRKVPDKHKASKLLVDGDLIITMSSGSPAHIGKCCVFIQPTDDKPYYFSNFTLRLRAHPGKASPRWLFHWLSSPGGRAVLDAMNSTTSGLRNLNRKLYLAQKIPLPPLPEQQRIAAILDKADAVRRKRQQTLDLADLFLRSAFLDLFGDPVTNPKHWPIKKLADITQKVTDGEHLNPTFSPTGMPMVMARNVLEDRVDVSGAKTVRPDVGEGFRRKCNPEKRDLLIVSRGATIGRLCVVDVDSPFCLMGSVILVKPRKDIVDSSYLCALLKHPATRRALHGSSGSSAQQAIYLKDVGNLKCVVPPMVLQREFARLDATVRELIAAHNDSIGEQTRLFSALQQCAFRGELA